jgi:hypothetical protein
VISSILGWLPTSVCWWWAPADPRWIVHWWLPSVLVPELRRGAADERGLRLYRHILPPEESNLGFVGYASSIANTLTSELSAQWLSDAFAGRLRFPEEPAMRAEISRVQLWAERTSPAAREAITSGPSLRTTRTSSWATWGFRPKGTPISRPSA